jgi:hypothetical protein
MLLERAHWLFGSTSLAALEEKPQQRIVIRGRSDFFLRAYGIRTASTSTGDCEFRGRRPDDSYFQSGWVHQQNILDDPTLGSVPALFPIAPELRYALNGYFSYDIRGVNNPNPADVFDLALQGVTKFDGDPTELGYPENYEEEAASFMVTFEISAGTKVPNLQIRHPDRSVAFAIRGLTWCQDLTFSAGDTVRSIKLLIRDHNDQAYMNTAVPIDMMFSDQPGLMGTPYPEMVIPAGRAFSFDATQDIACEAGGPWRICLGFVGAFLHAR